MFSLLLGIVCDVKEWLRGGGGIGRKGEKVRERTRVGWKEETKRKTKGCDLIEESVCTMFFFGP
jgi:hypothetical protein